MESVPASASEWIDAADAYAGDCMAAATATRASELALRLNLSAVQLARVFQAAVGANISAFLKARQIERAKGLLRDTDLPAATIALSAGFGTARTFYRLFRRATGMTPAAFRGERNVSRQSSSCGHISVGT
ncbi:MAG TPA: helix-turn-helix transcriptional regulator [Thermoanaerobaculia bacterium]|jgi:AraC-like DNA-binding protein|nr:helix-turn-helix transcriptional regulator [Thermoanaerobaculia bacterium]